ncbi:MAG: hypothetical protein M9962_12510 [Oligoflexia bacterium]|nr:hypothetical protein [Oligoflexia bacterium]
MLLSVNELEGKLLEVPAIKTGCIVDTNIVFAASFPLDTNNEWSEQIFEILHRLEIPIYTNQNVRSEFIDLNRRVLVPEGLVDFYEDFSQDLSGEIESKLKSLKTRKAKATAENRTFKFSDNEIKEYMQLFEQETHSSQKNAWYYFCKSYLYNYIEHVWEEAVSNLQLNFLGTREIDLNNFFNRPPSWEKMVKIVGLSGIGSSDAMIINLFQESKIPLIITADRAFKNTLLSFIPENKFILVP